MPAGYVYVGKVWTGVAVILLVLAAATAIFLLSFVYPPGFFAFSDMAGLKPYFVLAVPACVGLHAGLLAIKPRAILHPLLFWTALFGLPLAIVALGALFRAFFPLAVYSIPSISSWPTLDRGDVVAAYGARALCGQPIPKPGEMIIYKHNGSTYIKRVVARAGDTVLIRKGDLILNGAAVETQTVGSAPLDPADPKSPVGLVRVEKLANGANYKTLLTSDDGQTDEFGPYRVPPNSWFVLGDNRDNSLDSRTEGPVPQGAVCGVASKVVNARLASRIGQELGSPSTH